MIITQEKIKTTDEEFNSVNKQHRLSLSEQLEKERRKQNQPAAAIHNPDTKTVEEKYYD